MNAKQIHKFLERYLQSTNCTILEKSPAHFKVKLSPEADRCLTNRPYYWSFVERTGADPETMSFLFVTDRDKYESEFAQELAPPPPKPGPAALAQQQNSVQAALSRSFGHVPGQLGSRMPREDLHFGSRRLDQLFGAVCSNGKYVYLFQQQAGKTMNPFESVPYTAWLGVNVKVGFQCDMKREELHSYGVSLATGIIVEGFYDRLLDCKMTPRLPNNIHLAKSTISLTKAAGMIESALERKLRSYDYSWAEKASQRLKEELERVEGYYKPLIDSTEEEEKRADIEAQYVNRKSEIMWQLKPRVTASAINCGIFHLAGIE